MADHSPEYSPYDFVPLQGTPDRRAFPGHHRLGDDAWSGTLVCELEALTPLFTADHRRGTPRSKKDKQGASFPFLRDSRNRPILQGTSLKGMIRSVYEAYTNSCLVLAETSRRDKKRDREVYRFADLPAAGHARCSESTDAVCPACRLFGVIAGEQLHARGRLTVSDAQLTGGSLERRTVYLAELSSPKPRHYPIYSTTGRRNGPIAGRKLYVHHDPGDDLGIPESDWNDRSSATLEHAPPETRFTFQVHLDGLTGEELARLLLCLELVDKHAHKLGMARPLGYGSCRIRVDPERSSLWQGAGRYRTWDPQPEPLDLQAHKATAAALPPALARLLAYPGKPHEGVGYLGYRGYRDMGLDAQGRYVRVNPRGSGSGAGSGDPGSPPGGGGFRMGEGTGLAKVQGRKPAPPPGAPKRQSEPPRHRKNDKVRTEVLEATSDGFKVRVKETGQEVEVRGDFPWHPGQRLKMRVLKVDSEGRILELRP